MKPMVVKAVGGKKHITLDSFVGEQKGDLSFDKGEILTVLAER